ncbi:NblA/ycf18 family protein [Planktothrix paucivesiculata]|uniref:Phycobilisome degradation protein NblA homolog 2 n=1 Tax=Planktothrix paucivesiculata PCC 9631 TaxID=671071 RepID=A0A7Z9E4E9_9CYAN|nr:NblA/ycf18 family protein [Planktothrix paucivesiculata]OIP71055.1 MAG: phycobilisome degradation protein nblA [Oscillatoriales cyanobacterium CG2_30_40_61]VXD22525.1 Phycobilisome degradation protein NblA homolog 2 [Planktothrix paucivesiculata PCC 9631]
METPANLSLEQQFKLQILREQVKNLNLEQAQDYLLELLRQSMVKDNLLRQWIKNP